MPLLLCPNDNAAMTTVNRSGVEFDMCPACRGVWLDRGELEKMIEAGANASVPTSSAVQPQYPVGQVFRRDRDDGHRANHDRDDSGYRKKKRLDIFDIFD